LTPPDSDALAKMARAGRSDDGPVFAEPWQAQAFALAVQLNRQGAFTWSEWAQALSVALHADGGPDAASEYYACWLAALETITATKGLTDPAALAKRKSEWADAYRATPHGAPVELSAARPRTAESRAKPVAGKAHRHRRPP
jgi:nitrile hydratase accessory protein